MKRPREEADDQEGRPSPAEANLLKLEERYAEVLEKLHFHLAGRQDGSNDIVKLNLGGKNSSIRRGSIVDGPIGWDNLLSCLLNKKWDPLLPRDKENRIYFDWEADWVMPLLEYCRYPDSYKESMISAPYSLLPEGDGAENPSNTVVPLSTSRDVDVIEGRTALLRSLLLDETVLQQKVPDFKGFEGSEIPKLASMLEYCQDPLNSWLLGLSDRSAADTRRTVAFQLSRVFQWTAAGSKSSEYTGNEKWNKDGFYKAICVRTEGGRHVILFTSIALNASRSTGVRALLCSDDGYSPSTHLSDCEYGVKEEAGWNVLLDIPKFLPIRFFKKANSSRSSYFEISNEHPYGGTGEELILECGIFPRKIQCLEVYEMEIVPADPAHKMYAVLNDPREPDRSDLNALGTLTEEEERIALRELQLEIKVYRTLNIVQQMAHYFRLVSSHGTCEDPSYLEFDEIDVLLDHLERLLEYLHSLLLQNSSSSTETQSVSPVVYLNVNGEVCPLLRCTLKRFMGESQLAVRFSGRWEAQSSANEVDEEGNLILAMPSEPVRDLLKYARYQCVMVPFVDRDWDSHSISEYLRLDEDKRIWLEVYDYLGINEVIRV